jgi:hypothetical protein
LLVLECLYTDHYLTNPSYSTQWEEVRNLKKYILQENFGGVLNGLQERASINIQYFIRQVGEKNQNTKEKYYVKPVIHILRLENILEHLLNKRVDNLFLFTGKKQLICDLRNGKYSFQEAQTLMFYYYKTIMTKGAQQLAFYSTEPSKKLVYMANRVLDKIKY